MNEPRSTFQYVLYASALVCILAAPSLTPTALADGKLMPPRDYKGSLEESSQEAILIFHGSKRKGEAVEELILKITVEGEAKTFGWVVPFPETPEVAREDARLFRELFAYVETRTVRARLGKKGKFDGATKAAEGKEVEVISRKVVGSYDVAVVRERKRGALNEWLESEGFQTLPDGEEVIDFYRKKGYVFACMKVSGAALEKGKAVDLHPLRFTFKTGGRDGMFFPMKMTGLQTAPFHVNLYVFYKAWLNNNLNRYGFVNRGFRLRFRDWDSRDCEANAGKNWSAPSEDPYLRPLARKIPTVASLFQKLHPGQRYYLTNLQAWNLKPRDVRDWSDDLWLFPYYTDPDFVPYDAREGGVAEAAWRRE